MAITEAVKEAIWLNRLAMELGLRKSHEAIQIWADNQSVITLSNNPEFHRRTKHINMY